MSSKGVEKKKVAVICADDEAIILLGLARSLKEYLHPDIEIHTALNGNEALNLVRRLQRDEKIVVVLFSDWNMPGMKGDELFQIVHKEFPHIFLIMLSAYTKATAESEIQDVPHMYITKPINHSELQRICENLELCGDFQCH